MRFNYSYSPGRGSSSELPLVPVTKVLYVDQNRSDTYTEDGSPSRPFKTISAAVAVATSSTTIRVIPGTTYVEDITLPANVSLEGFGANYLTLDGDLTVSSGGQTSLRFLRVIGTGNSVTIDSNCILWDTYFSCATVVGGSATIQSYNAHIVPPAGVTALTMNSTGKFHSLISTIASTDDVPTIHQTAGTLVLNTVLVSGSRVGPVILSEGGTVAILNTQALNMAGGIAIDGSANSATGSNPNLISSVLAIGNIDFAAKPVLSDGAQFLGVGSLLGTAVTHRAASQIDNDSSLTGSTVKDALDSVAWVPDMPADGDWVLRVSGGVATWVSA